MRIAGHFLLLILLAFALAACGQSQGSPTPTPLEHSPTPSWQRVTFVYSRLHPAFALDIPVSWQYQVAERGITLFNQPQLLELQEASAPLPSGTIVANIRLLLAVDEQVPDVQNAVGMLEAYIGASPDDGEGPYRRANLLDMKDHAAAQATTSTASSDTLLLAIELAGNYALVTVLTPAGELAGQAALLNQIFNSIELQLSQ